MDANLAESLVFGAAHGVAYIFAFGVIVVNFFFVHGFPMYKKTLKSAILMADEYFAAYGSRLGRLLGMGITLILLGLFTADVGLLLLMFTGTSIDFPGLTNFPLATVLMTTGVFVSVPALMVIGVLLKKVDALRGGGRGRARINPFARCATSRFPQRPCLLWNAHIWSLC